MSGDIVTSPRLSELLRMRRFLDAEIAEELLVHKPVDRLCTAASVRPI